ncbi:alpha-N-arabinofuranosidase [Pseudoxanthomonas wuyuanensis]|uniref:non-reducing end alpha-L-arabinofuranosidase n=1 Tax=Pseudoxanthomonas wuyuanensis TaxID=1073196 RepID=A0A286DAZ9_9GAMM|nr:alpha-L-arabinofuranosidase C-terminal domain-containing protein [Pseudoxanthomonas wuyuanensis]KAF1721861.1 alpha-N-arabinofuranosidase [Pseudoxanthomonas wuyuanensis]SOD55798.1 alpha-N-arabinofuranosidase [Pseudoxanthomonas wuyuanensis]
MKAKLLHAAILALSVCTAAATAAEPAQVRLTVATDAAGARIEPEIYGHFVEHLGTGVYDGLWVGPESKIPNTRGWRNDLVEALRRLEVPVMRWPGGCFADDYDWRDGIGDPAKRPVRLNKWWGKVPESNRVGTHEFMDLVELLDSEAYLAGNMGSMPPRAMAQWLEYMTSDSQSTLAQERRRNGRDQPWKVKYFGVGNESWGCGGNMRPEYQADLHNQYATFLHAPVVRAASGDGTGDDHVTEVMMARSAKHMDALTLHYYTVAGTWEKKGGATGFDAGQWAKALQVAMDIEKRIVTTVGIMDKHDPDKRVALYVDEWGTWHDPEPGSNPGFLQQQNTLRDALVAALSFNVFHRHTERVKMANIAQMVNVLQAMALTDGPRMTLTPTYHAFDLYKPFRGATPLKAELQAPRWREGDIELPSVDVSAARAADGSLVLALVNLDPQRPARVQTNLSGVAQGRVLTAGAMDAHNTFAQPDALVPAPYQAGTDGTPLALELPPKSIVVVSVPK